LLLLGRKGGEMAGEDKATTDHETIRQWVEEHGGVPAAVKNTLPGDEAGVLYIDFPGSIDKDVDEIPWEVFFKKFDEQNLALVYQDEPPGSDLSRSWQLVPRAAVAGAHD
jgi:hypothetical protein